MDGGTRHRWAGAVLGLLVATALLVPSTAQAAVSLTRASLTSTGTLTVEGRGAVPRATVRVQSPESTASGQADSSGRFRFGTSGFRSSTCRATVTDGTTPVAVTLSGCTAAPAPGPAPAPGALRLTPESAELGPGAVGADFLSTSTTTTAITLGPDAVGPVRFEVVAGQLPAGLRLTLFQEGATTPAKLVHGAISGTPTTVQTSSFTVTATDAGGRSATRTWTIRVGPPRPLAITPQAWAPLAVGAFSNLWIDGTGGVLPYTWARTSGVFPAGMSLVQDSPGGPLVRITGTPSAPGTSTWTLRLTDAQGASVSRTLTATVPASTTPAPPAAPALLAPAAGATVPGPVVLDWTETFDPSLSPNGGYNWQLSAGSAFGTPVRSDSTLPTVTQDTVSDLAPGTYSWRVQAVDGQLQSSPWSASRSFTVAGPAAPAPPPAASAALTVTATGRSGERVTSSPAGLDVAVGSTRTATFPAGTTVRLSTPTGRDVVWSGACSSGGLRSRSCTLVLQADDAVTASVQ